MEKEYLSLKELVALIPYAKQTVYNWISSNQWQMGVHYHKPTPRKLIFHYPTIVRWLEGQSIGKGHKSTHPGAARDAVL